MNDVPPNSEEPQVRPDINEPDPANPPPPCCDPSTPIMFSEEPSLDPALIGKFLKQEMFYIIVVLLIMAAGIVNTLRSYDTQEPRTSIDTISQRGLDTSFESKLQELEADGHHLVRFVNGVAFLNRALVMAGVGLAVIVLLLWIARGCILAPMPPEIPSWGLWDVLKTAALFAGGGVIFMLILRATDDQAFATPRTPTASILSGLLLIGAIFVVACEGRGAKAKDLGVKGNDFLRGIILGLFAFVLLQPLLHGMMLVHMKANELWPTIPGPELQRSAQELLVTPSHLALFLSIFAAVIIAPIAEELLFRGFLLPALKRWMNPLAAVWLSAAFFGAAHASQSDVFILLPMFVMGIVLSYLYDRTRTLAAPITAHMTYNALVVLNLLVYRMVLLA